MHHVVSGSSGMEEEHVNIKVFHLVSDDTAIPVKHGKKWQRGLLQ